MIGFRPGVVRNIIPSQSPTSSEGGRIGRSRIHSKWHGTSRVSIFHALLLHKVCHGAQSSRTPIQRRSTGQQPLGVGVARMVQYLLRTAAFHNLTVIHHRHIVGYLRYHTKVVSDENHRYTPLPLQLAQQLQYGLLHRHIQRGCRLVGNHQLGFAHQRHGYHHPLLLSSAQLMGITLKNLLRPRQQHLFKQGQHTLPRLLIAYLLVQPQHLQHLFPASVHRVQARHRFLENHADTAAADVAQCGLVEPNQLGLSIQHRAAVNPCVFRQQPH